MRSLASGYLRRVIDERFKAIYGLIPSNPEVTEEALLPIQDILESMDDKLNILLPKCPN